MGSLRAWSLTQVSSVLSSPQFPTLLMPRHFTMSSGALWVQCENHSTWVIRCFESICQGHVRQETEALTLSFKCQLSEGTLLLRLSYLLKSHMSWVHCRCHKTKVEKGPQGARWSFGEEGGQVYCHLLPLQQQRAGPPGMHPGAAATPRGAEDKGHLEAVVLNLRHKFRHSG